MCVWLSWPPVSSLWTGRTICWWPGSCSTCADTWRHSSGRTTLAPSTPLPSSSMLSTSPTWRWPSCAAYSSQPLVTVSHGHRVFSFLVSHCLEFGWALTLNHGELLSWVMVSLCSESWLVTVLVMVSCAESGWVVLSHSHLMFWVVVGYCFEYGWDFLLNHGELSWVKTMLCSESLLVTWIMVSCPKSWSVYVLGQYFELVSSSSESWWVVPSHGQFMFWVSILSWWDLTLSHGE